MSMNPGHHWYRFLCPQCGSPTDGTITTSGDDSSFCEDCVGDREIGDGGVPSTGTALT